MSARSDAGPAATMARIPALRRLVDLEDDLDDGFFAAAQRTLRELIADPALLAALPPADAGGFARRLLYTDPNERFGIWALSWPPGWRTPIHNHHCACAFAVPIEASEVRLVERDPIAATIRSHGARTYPLDLAGR